MDIDQAIKILKRTTFFNGRSGSKDFYAAIDLAIQALQEMQGRETSCYGCVRATRVGSEICQRCKRICDDNYEPKEATNGV